MSWFLGRLRSRREQQHHQKVRKLQEKQWDRIHKIENKYSNLNFFAAPDSSGEEPETGMIPDARERYALYLLNRVGILFIPADALILARKFGPALAAERVCRWLGLDYHKIAAVAPRVASETARATMYFEEMHDACETIGINADALLPHIHFGSHDTRDILFENFRISSRIIEIYDNLSDSIQQEVEWEKNRPAFIDGWKAISADCLLRYFNQGLLLLEYQRTIERGARVLDQCGEDDPNLELHWLSEEVTAKWMDKFPTFDVVILLVHLSNRIREVNYRSSREWNEILKKVMDTNFDFEVATSIEIEEVETVELEGEF